MNAVFLGILGYIGISLVIGLLVSRRVRNESDYLIAGRSLGPVLATFSIFATWFGAETCVGASAAAYDFGLAGGNADPFGYTLCLLLMGLIFAGPMWKRKLTTLADLYRQRFSPTVEKVAALVIAPSSVIWAAAQIRAFGHVLSVSSQWQLDACIWLAAAIVTVYTVSGGLWADAYTDVIQGIALIVGMVALAVILAMNPETPSWDHIRLNLFHGIAGKQEQSWLALFDSWAIPVFGSIVAQELVSRVIAARSLRVARRSTFLATFMYLCIGLIPVYIGLIGISMLPQMLDSEQVMPQLALKYLPTGLYVLYAGAVASAILSTVDSALLAASALLEHNVVVSSRPAMSEKAKLLTARGGVLILGIIATVLALYGTTTYEMVEAASSLGSAGIFVITVFGMFTKMGGSRAAIAALLVGLGISIWGNYVHEFDGSYVLAIGAAAIAYVTTGMTERKVELA
jgi:Na+/proline symporter